MSRNILPDSCRDEARVASREGRVSRNSGEIFEEILNEVASREGRVSRNATCVWDLVVDCCRVPRGACE